MLPQTRMQSHVAQPPKAFVRQQPLRATQDAVPRFYSRAAQSSPPLQKRQQVQLWAQRQQGICRAQRSQAPVQDDKTYEDKAYDELADSIRELAGTVKDQLGGTSIYLVGMMGCGKSTVGKLLAAALQYCFFDTDTLVEQHTGQTVQEIWEDEGEGAFREVETVVLKELAPFRDLVVATGGGAVTKRENWGHMNHAISVWLDGPPPLLATRLVADSTESRPLVAPQEGDSDEYQATVAKLDKLLQDRRGQYAISDIKVSLSKSDGNANLGAPPAVVAHRVLSQLKKRLAERSAELEAVRKRGEQTATEQ